MKPVPHTEAAPGGARWYHQPVAWLAALILFASLAAIAVTIVVAERFPDESLPAASASVLKAPVARAVDTGPPAAPEPAE